MAAAPAISAPSRLGKLSAQDGLDLDLQPTEDILAALAATQRDQTIVGFAAEHGATRSAGPAPSSPARAPT